MYVTALTSFDHYGSKRRGEIFMVSDVVANQLIRAKLVKPSREAAKENPQKPDGESASASLAGLVLPQMIAPKPKRGKKKALLPEA